MTGYGCVKCQTHHYERDGAIYADHRYFMDKHGLKQISEATWAFGRIAAPDSPVGNYVDAVRRLNRERSR